MAQRWLKGNTHTHTTYSDGDSSPETVVDWCVDHGYDFIFLTDHNVIIPNRT
jgi:predicted metal-dependent phosphoesterase TrpH